MPDNETKRPLGLEWPQEDKSHPLGYLPEHQRKAVEDTQERLTEELTNIFVDEENYERELDRQTDRFIAGEITEEEVSKGVEKPTDWMGLIESGWESTKRLFTGKEGPLDPARAEAAKQNIPYPDISGVPTATMDAATIGSELFSQEAMEEPGLGGVATGLLRGISKVLSEKPDDYQYGAKLWQDQPRRARIEHLMRPLYDEKGNMDIDAFLRSSDLPLGDRNEIALRATAHKYNISLPTLRKLMRMRLGHEADDFAVTSGIKFMVQALDGLMFRIPTMISTKIGKATNEEEFAKVLQRPKGVSFLTPEQRKAQIDSQMKAIKNGKVSELNINGMEIDVDPTDTVDTIEDKAYREYMELALAQVENLATSPAADLAGMVVPVSKITTINKSLKGAQAARNMTKSLKVAETVAKPSTLGTASDMASVVFNPVIEAVAPKVAEKLQQNAVARVGDWLITSMAAPPALAAIGAPAGTEKETAKAVAGFTVPLVTSGAALAVGIPAIHAKAITVTAKLKDKQLIKAIRKAETFDDLPNYHKNKIKKLIPEAPEEYFNSLKASQRKHDTFVSMLNDEELARKNNVSPNSYEFLRMLSTEEASKDLVNRFAKEATMGKALTVEGRVAQRTIAQHLSDINKMSAEAHSDFQAGRITKSALEAEKNRYANWKTTLRNIMYDRPDLLENWTALLDYMREKDHPLAAHFQNQLQISDVHDLVFDDLQYLVQGRLTKDMTPEEYVDVLSNGTIPKTNAHDQLFANLIQQQAKDEARGRTSVNVEATLIKAMENPLEVIEDIDKIQQVVRRLGELEKAKELGVPIKKELKKDLEAELNKVSKVAKAKSKVIDNYKSELSSLKKFISSFISETLSKTETPSSKYFHGAADEIKELFDGYYNDSNIYGDGFYTTDNVDIAKSYVKKNRKTAGKNAKPTVYSIIEKEPVKFYDLDAPISEDGFKVLEVLRADNGSALVDSFEALDSGNIKTMTEFFDDLRTHVNGYDLTRSDFSEIIYGIRDDLSKLGYGGFSHKGGRITGGKSHNVRIYWEPHSQIDIKPYVDPISTIVTDTYNSIRRNGHIPSHVKELVNDIINNTDNPAQVRNSGMVFKEYIKRYEANLTKLQKATKEYDEYVSNYLQILEDRQEYRRVIPVSVEKELADAINKNVDIAQKAMDRYLRELNPSAYQALNRVGLYSQLTEQANNAIARGMPTPSHVKQYLSLIVNDADAFRELATEAFGMDRKMMNPVALREYIREVADFYKATEDVFIQGRTALESIERAIMDESEDAAVLASKIAHLKDTYQYASLKKLIDNVDTKIFKYFEKSLKGSRLNVSQRKQLYNFLSGSLIQRVSKLIRPDWMITNKQYAQGYFKSLQVHSAEAIGMIAERYNDTFGTDFDDVAFASIFINAQNVQDLGGDTKLLLELARARRDRNVDFQVFAQYGLNQEALSELIQDKALASISDSLDSLGAWKAFARTDAYELLVQQLITPLHEVKHNGFTFFDVYGRSSFAEKFKRFMGVQGFQEWTHLVGRDGQSSLTEFGEILYTWKTKYPDRPVDEAMDAVLGSGWRDNEVYAKKWKPNLVQYWADTEITKRDVIEYRILFDAMKIIQEFDYKKIEKANEVIRDVNGRYGTTYSEFSFQPYRLMMKQDKGLGSAFSNPALIDRTTYDTVFGRHIETTKDGQINKIREVHAGNAANPWEIILADTMHMMEHVHTNHFRKQLLSTSLRLNQLGYYTESIALARTMGEDASNAHMALFSLPNKAIHILYKVPLLGEGMMLFRGLFGSKVILSKPGSVLLNAVGGAATAALNPKDIKTAFRTLFAYPALLLNRAFMVTEIGKTYPGYSQIRTLTPELRGDTVGVENLMRRSSLGVGESSGIGRRIVEEALVREQNAGYAAQFSLYATAFNYNSPRMIKRTLMGINTSVDALSDGMARYMKESMELSQAKAVLTDAMLIWEKAIDLARENPNPQAVGEFLIASMADLRNQAPFFKLGAELVRNVKDNPYRGSLEYITLYKNYVLGRFDPSNVPLYLKQLGMMVPGVSQFYNAISNHIYRIFTLSRRVFKPEDDGKRVMAAMVLSSMVLQSLIFGWMKDGVGSDQDDEASIWKRGLGINGERISGVPWLTTAASGLMRPDKFKVSSLLNAKLHVGGMEHQNYARALSLLMLSVSSHGNTPFDEFKQQEYLAMAMDQLTKMSPAVILMDFFSKPSLWTFRMITDVNDEVMRGAVNKAINNQYDLRLFTWFSNKVNDIDNINTDYDFWERIDHAITFAGALGYSDAAAQLMKMKSKFYHRQKVIDDVMLDEDPKRGMEYNLRRQKYIERLLQEPFEQSDYRLFE